MDYTLLIIILAILVFVIGRRVIAGTRGTKYSVRSIFIRPVIYIILSIVLLIGLQLWQIGVMLVAVVAGAFVGLELGKRSDIFEKDGKIMYKRSNEVLAIWIVAFVVRIGIDFFTNPFLNGTNSTVSNSTNTFQIISAASQANQIVFGADILLVFSAGLLLGEAFVLLNDFNSKYKK